MPWRPGLVGMALVVTSGCEISSVEVAEPEDVVVAEIYLRTDVASQEAYLYRTLPGPDNSLRVDNASIRIIRDDGEAIELVQRSFDLACAQYTVLPEDDMGTCYGSDAVAAFVRPGRSYTLEVSLADGRELAGVTTVPGDFEIVRPAEELCVMEETSYEMVWTPAEDAWSYPAVADFSGLAPGLEAFGIEDPPDELELLGLAIGAADTTIAFPSEFGVFDRFSVDRDLLVALQQGLPLGARADVVVAAGDRNYVNWVRGGNFNPSGQVRVPSITGDGTGVFASLVVRRQVFVNPVDRPPNQRDC